MSSNIHITNDIQIDNETADKILRLAYLKGYLGKCEDVTNGCDFYRYDPVAKNMYFHIINPLFWVELSLKEFIDCYTDILAREINQKAKR